MKKHWIGWGISCLFTMTCSVINMINWRVQSILPLEFANSAEQMQENIAKICGTDKYHILLMNTNWDYGFLIGYSFIALFSFLIFFDVFQLKVKFWIVCLLSFTTGLLDAIENSYLHATGSRHVEQYSEFYHCVVRIKWGWSIITFLIILMIMLYGMFLVLVSPKK